ncbi:MAG: hemolysin III family protein [Saccharofermentans sp.]|nr:hemolysin III family protein [Saccharofermentans sp.]
MAKNNKHWKSMMANEADRSAAKDGIDPLEEGLEGLSWLENSRRIVKQTIKKTRETFGEEVGNSITSGVLAIYLLFMIPYASVHSYITAPEGKGCKYVVAYAAFFLFMFLASLFTTVYHSMKHGTPQKRVFGKLDHIAVYFAILGTYAPICLCILPEKTGIGILIAEAALAVLGMFLMIFMYPTNKVGTGFAKAIYAVMGLIGVFVLGTIKAAVSTACFWLLIAGVIIYVCGTFFYSGKKFKFSHMVWHFCVLFAAVCHVLALVYFI